MYVLQYALQCLLSPSFWILILGGIERSDNRFLWVKHSFFFPRNLSLAFIRLIRFPMLQIQEVKTTVIVSYHRHSSQIRQQNVQNLGWFSIIYGVNAIQHNEDIIGMFVFLLFFASNRSKENDFFKWEKKKKSKCQLLIFRLESFNVKPTTWMKSGFFLNIAIYVPANVSDVLRFVFNLWKKRYFSINFSSSCFLCIFS